MKISMALLAFLVLLGLAAAQQNSNVQELANRLAQMHRGWGPLANTAQATLTLKEVARSGNAVTYRLYASGLPQDQSYSIVSWPVTQQQPGVMLQGVSLNSAGLAICAGTPNSCGSPDKPNDPIDIVLKPVKGEPVRLALISADGQRKAFQKIVPIPNQATSKECSLQAVLLSPNASEVAIEGAGFGAGTELTVETNTAGEKHKLDTKAAPDGTYFSAILPYVKGQTHGKTEVTVKSSNCAVTVGFDWGNKTGS